jgi:hypothetical protein
MRLIISISMKGLCYRVTRCSLDQALDWSLVCAYPVQNATTVTILLYLSSSHASRNTATKRFSLHLLLFMLILLFLLMLPFSHVLLLVLLPTYLACPFVPSFLYFPYLSKFLYLHFYKFLFCIPHFPFYFHLITESFIFP